MIAGAAPFDGRSLTRRLLAVLLVAVLGVNVALMLASPPAYRETVLDQTAAMLAGEGGDDSWGVMHVALEQFAAAPARPLYSELFFARLYRFQYPPSSLFALMTLRLAGPEHVRVADGMSFAVPPVNDIVAWIFLALTGLAAAAILETRLSRTPGFVDRSGLMWLRVAIVLALALTFYPLVKAYTLGQIQVWINAWVALALLCCVRGRTALAGVLIGVSCLIKPHYGILVLWAMTRRDWPFALAASGTILVGLIAAVAVFGWTNHLDYVRVLQFLSEHGEAYFPNQSVNGLANRLMALSDPAQYVVLDIPAGKFPPFNPWVYGATFASSLALLLYGLLRRDRADHARDFARMLLCCTMASPIAWEHHYGILFPIFALLLAEHAAPRRTAALAAAYLLAANFLPGLSVLAGTIFNPAMSYVLLAAFVVLGLLHAPSPVNRRATTAAAAAR